MLDRIVLQIAKTTLQNIFDSSKIIDKKSLLQNHPFLAQNGASFVTLNKNKELRGCIGSLEPYRSLLEDIISNTKAAALNDPRFSPLDLDELSSLDLEVSLLSPSETIHYENFEDLCEKIIPHKDGLILEHGGYRGTFLPQVWEQLPSPKEFLEHLAYKAGATPSIYNYCPKISRYHVEALEEKFDAIPLLQE